MFNLQSWKPIDNWQLHTRIFSLWRQVHWEIHFTLQFLTTDKNKNYCEILKNSINQHPSQDWAYVPFMWVNFLETSKAFIRWHLSDSSHVS